MVESNENNSPEILSHIILQESIYEYYFDKYILFIGFGSAMILLFFGLFLTILRYIYTNFLYIISFSVIVIIIIILFVKYFIINGIKRKRIVLTGDGIILPFPHKKNPNNNFVPISDIIKVEIRENQIKSDNWNIKEYGWNFLLFFRNGEEFLIDNETIGDQNHDGLYHKIKTLLDQKKIKYEIKMLVNQRTKVL